MKLFNTLSGRADEFTAPDQVVRMYVCGITPYAPTHAGHAMSAVVFDVLRRYLEFKGFRVRHVQNFTDVDDKMIQAAAREGVAPAELAERNIRAFLEEMDALNVQRATVYPRATQEIPRIVEMVRRLVELGHAYAAEGDVYFRVRRHPGYGKLSRRSLDGLMAGARVEVGEHKEDALDFALWKAMKPGEPAWDSPWGPGRPGWHIECSAMALGYLGESLDIHGGGQDLIFPHHENEIAQSEAYTGKAPFARFWTHHGLLRAGADKMSKSLGNFVTVREGLNAFSADALRLFFLSSHYRSPLTYSEEAIAAQERALDRLRYAADAVNLRSATSARAQGALDRPRHAADTVGPRGDGRHLDPQACRQQFGEAMDDDLNTPRAIAALFDLARDINRGLQAGDDVDDGQATLRELASVLGLTLTAAEDRRVENVGPFVDLLVEARATLRDAKRFQEADHLRARLADLGVVLEDTPRGTEWRLARPS